jgi:hypothetical protein
LPERAAPASVPAGKRPRRKTNCICVWGVCLFREARNKFAPWNFVRLPKMEIAAVEGSPGKRIILFQLCSLPGGEVALLAESGTVPPRPLRSTALRQFECRMARAFRRRDGRGMSCPTNDTPLYTGDPC